MVGDSLIHNFFRDNMVPYLSRFKCSIPTNSVKYCSQVPVSIINYICTHLHLQRADSALYSGATSEREEIVVPRVASARFHAELVPQASFLAPSELKGNGLVWFT